MSLFSHPSAAAEAPGDRPDVHVSVSVPAPADHAWAGLTEHLHLWWPADELSRWGSDSFFDLEDNALVETSAQDDENVWGEVVDGEPGQWLELRWRHVGTASATSVRLELSRSGEHSDAPAPVRAEAGLSAAESEMVLTLDHGGWAASDPQDVYDFYQEFWPEALGRYRRFMGGS